MLTMQEMILRIEELSPIKLHAILKIEQHVLEMIQHLSKCYNNKDREYGNIYNEIFHIQSVNFAKLPSRTKYYRYLYIGPLKSGLHWSNTHVGAALEQYSGVTSESEYTEFDQSIQTFMYALSYDLSNPDWDIRDPECIEIIDLRLKEVLKI